MPFCNEARLDWIEPPGHVRGYSSNWWGMGQEAAISSSGHPATLRRPNRTAGPQHHRAVLLPFRGRARAPRRDAHPGTRRVVLVAPDTPHSLMATGDEDLCFVGVTSLPFDVTGCSGCP